MIKNYFKLAWRNIIKSRFYSGVNIAGLSVGLAFTLIIGAYVWSELQVNAHLKNAGNQYILQSKWKDPNMGIDLTTLGPLAKALRDRFPDLVANYYRADGITSTVSKADKHFRESLQVGDSTFLNMYGFPLLFGNAKTAFDDPYSIVITEDRAIKYFGKKDVVGQTLTIENFSGLKHDFMVSGVMKAQPKNSVTWLSENYDNQFYLSAGSLGFFGRDLEQWANQYIVSYVELQKGITPKDLEKPMRQLTNDNASPQVAANMTPYLVPLKDYYLKADKALVEKMIYALSFIAFFILLMAVINFINMAVSRSGSRLKEIGIRKVLGGMKKQLVAQFLIESVILVLLATMLAILIYAVSRNFFSTVLGKEIPALSVFPVYFIIYPIALSLVVGVLAGIYPAFVFSSMKSVDSIKNKLATAKDKIWLRKSLAGFQFAIAAIVLIGAIIVSQQINYFFSNDLGYNKEYIVSAQVPRDWTPKGVQHLESVRKQFEAMPEVGGVTLSYEIPDGNNSGSFPVYKAGADSTATISTQLLYSDEYYASTYGIPMAAGIFFSHPGAFTDPNQLVINETQSKALGWNDPKDAIGMQLKFPGNPTAYKIAGVIKDFHFGSMQQQVPPVTFLHVNLTNTFRFLSFKLKPGNIGASMNALQKQWMALLAGAPFEYVFMDETLNKVYKTEIQLKKAAYTSTLLALIIVLLGVLGLISLSIQKRVKEIGIRKVLGSSVQGIIALFIKEFLPVIFIGGLIACPLAYIIMHNWLNGYAYRIEISAGPFIISVIMLAFITALLIGIQTIKAANANPSQSLRTE